METASFKGFSLRWSKHEILSRIQTELFNQFANEKFSAGGFGIHIKPLQSPEWHLTVEQNSIRLKLPLEFLFSKPEGLFSIEGSGSMWVDIRFEILFPEQSIDYQISIQHYQWLQTPVVSMGSIDFPIEFIADFIIKRLREKHLAGWVNDIRNSWDFDRLFTQINNQYLSNIPLGKNQDWYANLDIKRWVWVGLKDDNTHINGIFYLDYELMISNEKQTSTKLSPVHLAIPLSDLLSKTSHTVNFQCTFAGLERMIQNYSRSIEIGGKTFTTENVSIKKDKKLRLNFILNSPIEGSVSIAGEPYFVSDRQCLDVTGLEVDIKAEKFLLQLTSPILEKLVRSRIEDELPLGLTDFVNTLMTMVKKEFAAQNIIFFPKQVSIKNIGFSHDRCDAQMTIGECLISSPNQTWSLSTL